MSLFEMERICPKCQGTGRVWDEKKGMMRACKNKEFHTTAREARDEAVARVEANADDGWKESVLNSVRALAITKSHFTTDDVWEFITEAGLDVTTHEPRAMGAIMQTAKREGWIEATPHFKPSERVVTHANPKRVWKSLLFAETL